MMPQTIEYKNFTTKDGLLSDEIFNLHQDSQGYVWVFSEYGTLKYNGVEFKQVLKNLPFKESFIYCIYENTNGQKWVANSNANIYEVRNDSAIKLTGFEFVSDQLRNSVSEIANLVVDDSLNVYIYTKGFSYKMLRTRNKYFPINLSYKEKTDSVFIKTIEIKNKCFSYYLRSNRDEFLFRNGNKQSYWKLNNSIPIKIEYEPYSIPLRNFKKFNSTYYFSYSTFVCKKISKTQIKYIQINSPVLNFNKDKQKHLWVGTLNDGLYELNEKDSIINHYLVNTTVNDVLIDYENGLWVSTPTRGLFHFKNLQNRTYNSENDFGTSISYLKEIEEKLLIGTGIGAVFLIDKIEINRIRKSDKNSAIDIIKSKDSYLSIQTFDVEEINSKKPFEANPVINKINRQYNLFLKSTDTIIFTWRRGISFAVKNKIEKSLDFGLKILSSQLIKNKIWLGTGNGVYYVDAAFSENSKQINSIVMPDKIRLKRNNLLEATEAASIVKITEDKEGTIWFCSKGNGLYRLKLNKLQNFNFESGLPSDFINSISFSTRQKILLSTNLGLYIANFNADFKQLKWEKIIEGEVKEALIYNNKIYASNRNGLVIIDEYNKISFTNTLFYNLAIITVNEKTVLPSLFKTLESNQNNVGFKFDLITFSSSKPKVYYRLQGPTSDSGIVDFTNFKFTNLLPGSYVFKTYPTSNVISNTHEITFEVLPAFWQTIWFKLIELILACLIISGIVFLLLRNKEKKKEIKSKNEKLIQEYKLIALQTQINPHFISNCLMAIQNLILANETENATYYVSKFGLLVRQILDFSSKQTILLSEEVELTKLYLELETLRFKNKFEYKIDFKSEKTELEKLAVPPLILNPIIENAIWHGLIPIQKIRQGILQIEISAQMDLLVIRIKDNGVGINSKRLQNKNENRKSYGLDITKQRLNNINYLSNQTTSKITTEELLNLKQEVIGTSVTIYLPNNLSSLNG